MKSDVLIRPATPSDRDRVTEIFNYFVINTMHTYLDEPVGRDFFDSLWQNTPTHPFYIAEHNGVVIGYGLTKPYSTLAKKDRTVELSYFLLPEYTGQGIGHELLDKITHDSRKRGVQVLVASIMGVNVQSIHFHEKMGFSHCGLFHRVIEKWGQVVDMVWMEKHIG